MLSGLSRVATLQPGAGASRDGSGVAIAQAVEVEDARQRRVPNLTDTQHRGRAIVGQLPEMLGKIEERDVDCAGYMRPAIGVRVADVYP